MATAFVPGQKLTAADLNSLAQLAAGPANPSDNYNWRQTSSGKLVVPWDNFYNTKNTNPQTLDIDMSIEALQTPIQLSSQSINGLRHVFINTGVVNDITTLGLYLIGKVPQIGRFNWVPFFGIIGWQIHDQDGIKSGDGQPHFSVWCEFGNQPTSDTPAAWEACQKLYQLDVCRNSSPNKWWWSGITLENMSAQMLASKWPANIVAYPLIVNVRLDNEEASNVTTAVPFLLISTQEDYLRRNVLYQSTSTWKLLSDTIESYFGSANAFNFSVVNMWIPADPFLVKPIATYTIEKNTQNGFYKQITNYVEFRKDNSGNKITQNYGSAYRYFLDNLQYIDSKGQQVVRRSVFTLTDLSGNELSGEMGGGDVPAALAIAWDYDKDEAVISCVSCDPAGARNSDNYINIAEYVLSGLFNDLSSTDIDKRLLWINEGDALNVMYFDPCPDFSRPDTTKFHFAWSTSLSGSGQNRITTAHIGEGVVQIGGYSYFSGGGDVQNLLSTQQYVCAEVSLADGSAGSIAFKGYNSISALVTAQRDLSKYIFPLYKTQNYAVEVDYRPMPNAGCWEVAENLSGGN